MAGQKKRLPLWCQNVPLLHGSVFRCQLPKTNRWCSDVSSQNVGWAVKGKPGPTGPFKHGAIGWVSICLIFGVRKRCSILSLKVVVVFFYYPTKIMGYVFPWFCVGEGCCKVITAIALNFFNWRNLLRCWGVAFRTPVVWVSCAVVFGIQFGSGSTELGQKWLLDGYLEDQPWLTSPLRIGLLSFQMAISWLINGGGPNHLLTGMILQVADDPCRPEKVLPGSRLPFRWIY